MRCAKLISLMVVMLMVLVPGVYFLSPLSLRPQAQASTPVNAVPASSPILVANGTADTQVVTYGDYFTLASGNQMAYTGPIALNAQRSWNGTVTFSYFDQMSFIAGYNTAQTAYLAAVVYVNLTVGSSVYSWSHAIDLFTPGHGTTPPYYVLIAPSWTFPAPSQRPMSINVSVTTGEGTLQFTTPPYNLQTTEFTGTGTNGAYTSPPSGSTTTPVPYVWGYTVYYAVTFTESGLPLATQWSVTLAGTPQSSTSTTITFDEQNGTFSFHVAPIGGYSANIYSGSITVNGGPVNFDVTWTQVKYTVTFTESGLPSGTIWYVNFTGQSPLSSTTTTITASEPNGTYDILVSSQNNGYHVASYSSTITVNGAPLSESVTFTKTVYTVTVSETGLPAGTLWSMNISTTVQQTTTSSISWIEGNGTYYYTLHNATGYSPISPDGSFTVNGASLPVDVFYGKTYTVTFTESGLAPGMNWHVVFDGYGQSSIGAITFNALNGTYLYSVPDVGVYVSSSSGGTVQVLGSGNTIAVTFTPTVFLSIVESGLPSGTRWTVYINGVTPYSSTTNTVQISVPAGPVSITIAASNGYMASPAIWNNGIMQNTTLDVNFTVAPPNNLLLFSQMDFIAAMILIFVPLALFIWIYMQRRRQ